MKFLKNKRAWQRWAAPFSRSNGGYCKPPVKFPCFVYTVVASFGLEFEQEVYLYQEDIEKMTRKLKSYK